MSSDTLAPHASAASPKENVEQSIDARAIAAALRETPRGAFLLACISVGLLFVGWLLFYFLLFMARGSVG
jgi:hypothetical protein